MHVSLPFVRTRTNLANEQIFLRLTNAGRTLFHDIPFRRNPLSFFKQFFRPENSIGRKTVMRNYPLLY